MKILRNLECFEIICFIMKVANFVPIQKFLISLYKEVSILNVSSWITSLTNSTEMNR